MRGRSSPASILPQASDAPLAAKTRSAACEVGVNIGGGRMLVNGQYQAEVTTCPMQAMGSPQCLLSCSQRVSVLFLPFREKAPESRVEYSAPVGQLVEVEIRS
jgi:hypothetical protein